MNNLMAFSIYFLFTTFSLSACMVFLSDLEFCKKEKQFYALQQPLQCLILPIASVENSDKMFLVLQYQ